MSTGSPFAWRLVHPLHSLVYASFTPRLREGRFHLPGDRVLYGWSSSEVAFQVMYETTGCYLPSQLVREKLRLPLFPNRVVPLVDSMRQSQITHDDLRYPRKLVSRLAELDILGIWLESRTVPSASVLVLNAGHAGMAQVEVVSSQVLTKGVHY